MAKDPDKPNVEYDDPAAKPSLEDLGSGPAERAVFGSYGGMGGFVRFVILLGLFLFACGVFFVFAN